MNTLEASFLGQSTSIRIEAEDNDVVPFGTFAGTIYKPLYRLNGRIIPSDTGDQLSADGLK
jgi:hypothetical protein